ncbi:uncharacterized protein [Phyllobates terribilis]|uniref:uncharacterized protein n=1 Tax=Phyllobates terribilis TaxID=111132 RepID=UPI003CCABD5E
MYHPQKRELSPEAPEFVPRSTDEVQFRSDDRTPAPEEIDRHSGGVELPDRVETSDAGEVQELTEADPRASVEAWEMSAAEETSVTEEPVVSVEQLTRRMSTRELRRPVMLTYETLGEPSQVPRTVDWKQDELWSEEEVMAVWAELKRKGKTNDNNQLEQHCLLNSNSFTVIRDDAFAGLFHLEYLDPHASAVKILELRMDGALILETEAVMA